MSLILALTYKENTKMAYYVFRINYSDYFSLIRKELIVQKKLRQGWGTYDMRVDQGYEAYKAG